MVILSKEFAMSACVEEEVDEKEGELGMGGSKSVARISVSFKFFENPEIIGVKKCVWIGIVLITSFVARDGQWKRCILLHLFKREVEHPKQTSQILNFSCVVLRCQKIYTQQNIWQN